MRKQKVIQLTWNYLSPLSKDNRLSVGGQHHENSHHFFTLSFNTGLKIIKIIFFLVYFLKIQYVYCIQGNTRKYISHSLVYFPKIQSIIFFILLGKKIGVMFKRKISETLLLKVNFATVIAQEVSTGPFQQTCCCRSPRMWDQGSQGKHEGKDENIFVIIRITPPAHEIWLNGSKIVLLSHCIYLSNLMWMKSNNYF